jgi:hypothetical protein
MKSVAEYAGFLGRELMDVSVTVTFVNTTNNFLACYAAGMVPGILVAVLVKEKFVHFLADSLLKPSVPQAEQVEMQVAHSLFSTLVRLLFRPRYHRYSLGVVAGS